MTAPPVFTSPQEISWLFLRMGVKAWDAIPALLAAWEKDDQMMDVYQLVLSLNFAL
jgi:hypothetical protein